MRGVLGFVACVVVIGALILASPPFLNSGFLQATAGIGVVVLIIGLLRWVAR
ncbi:MAG TPA: hypothetical protein VJR50_13675 [Mycobacterium sp.]|nr:hypothetical protein [Mycobacterium sp.]